MRKKKCGRCLKTKLLTEFYGRKKKTKQGIKMYASQFCQDCTRKINRERYQPKYKIRTHA
jgi:hypothetical protein